MTDLLLHPAQVEVKEWDGSSPDLAAWCAAEVDQLWAAQAIAWSRFITDVLSGLETRIFYASCSGHTAGVAIVHILKRIDGLDYLGKGPMSTALHMLARVGIRPLTFRVAFLEIPGTNSSGLFFGRHLSPPEQVEVGRAFLAKLRSILLDVQVLCLKVDAQLLTALACVEGLIRIPFLDNTPMAFDHASFESYLQSRSRSFRYEIRRKIRKFTGAGGTIDRYANPVLFAERLVDLYQQTRDHALAHGGLPDVIDPNRMFFERLAELPICTTLIAKLNGQPIGFLMLLQGGHTLIFKYCGLDYAHAVPTEAYFNLFYEGLRFAAEHRLQVIEWGATAYEFKQHMGCNREPTWYLIDFRGRLLRSLGSVLVKSSGQRIHEDAQ